MIRTTLFISLSILGAIIGHPTKDTLAACGPQDEGAVIGAPIIVSLPSAYSISADQVQVEPNIQLGDPSAIRSDEMQMRWLQNSRPSALLNESPPLQLPEELPPISPLDRMPLTAPSPEGIPQVAPIFDSILSKLPHGRPYVDPCGEQGLGRERLAFGLFDIDPAQPFNNFRARFAFGKGMQLPDRAEYFWGRTVDRRGPAAGESILDYQDLRLRMELGSKKFSTAFEVPFRAVDPVVNKNHAGLGDMQLIVKTVLLDGKKWLLTQYFGTHFATGSPGMGLGTGHVGLEPGLLFRNEWSELTWLHGELKFWFPLGADPEHHGQVMKFSTGANKVWMETDTSAIIPSFEITNYTVLNGQARDATGALRNVDGDRIVYLTPGVHYALDRNGDFGLFEVGAAWSVPISQERFADSLITFDLRWSW